MALFVYVVIMTLTNMYISKFSLALRPDKHVLFVNCISCIASEWLQTIFNAVSKIAHVGPLYFLCVKGAKNNISYLRIVIHSFLTLAHVI